MTTHTVKCESQYFQKMLSGEMTFQIRKNDRDYQKGDTLVLLEYDPKERCYVTSSTLSSHARNANVITFKITSVFTGHGFGLEPGYCVLSLLDTREMVMDIPPTFGLQTTNDPAANFDSETEFPNMAKTKDLPTGMYQFDAGGGLMIPVFVMSCGDHLFHVLPLKKSSHFKGDMAADVLVPCRFS